MIDLYSWATPNGQKISIALEELGLAYRLKLINIGADEQFAAKFLALSPNNRIPAIIDHDGPNCYPISYLNQAPFYSICLKKLTN